jgi:hypothetical protein
VPAADTGRSVGEVLALSSTAEVVDGHLDIIVRSGDTVLTSDPKDIKKILDARGVSATPGESDQSKSSQDRSWGG